MLDQPSGTDMAKAQPFPRTIVQAAVAGAVKEQQATAAAIAEMVCLPMRAPRFGIATPNVRAKRATTVARQARAVENAPAPLTGPGGLPLALRLSEGLGLAPCELEMPLLAPS